MLAKLRKKKAKKALDAAKDGKSSVSLHDLYNKVTRIVVLGDKVVGKSTFTLHYVLYGNDEENAPALYAPDEKLLTDLITKPPPSDFDTAVSTQLQQLTLSRPQLQTRCTELRIQNELLVSSWTYTISQLERENKYLTEQTQLLRDVVTQIHKVFYPTGKPNSPRDRNTIPLPAVPAGTKSVLLAKGKEYCDNSAEPAVTSVGSERSDDTPSISPSKSSGSLSANTHTNSSVTANSGSASSRSTPLHFLNQPREFRPADEVKRILREAIRKFNEEKAANGFKHLIQNGILKDTSHTNSSPLLLVTSESNSGNGATQEAGQQPGTSTTSQQQDLPAKQMADLLSKLENLSKAEVGNYLGHKDNIAVLREYVEYFASRQFRGKSIDHCLRRFFGLFRLPSEGQMVTRIAEAFSEGYSNYNKDILPNADTAYLLTCALLMLNTDAHNPRVKRKMTKQDFFKIFKETDLTQAYLGQLYDNIKENEIKEIGSDNFANVDDEVNDSGSDDDDDSSTSTSVGVIESVPPSPSSAPPAANEHGNEGSGSESDIQSGASAGNAAASATTLQQRFGTISTFQRRVILGENIHSFQIRDTHFSLGTSEIAALEREVSRGEAFMLIFAVTDRSSFKSVKQHIYLLRELRANAIRARLSPDPPTDGGNATNADSTSSSAATTPSAPNTSNSSTPVNANHTNTSAGTNHSAEMPITLAMVPIVLVGYRCDVQGEARQVSTEEAAQFAREHRIAYFECSTKTLQCVSAPFHYLFQRLIALKTLTSKMPANASTTLASASSSPASATPTASTATQSANTAQTAPVSTPAPAQ